MAITDNPLLNKLINKHRNDNGDARYCIKCGKPVIKNNKDEHGNEIPNNVLKFMWNTPLCLECFRRGPKIKPKPLERSF